MATEHKVYRVTGMSCQHCVKAVKTALESTSGVKSAAVDLDAGEAQVEVDGAVFDDQAAIAAIVDAGYEAVSA